MKAIISSTYDDQYLFFLPIINWCWNKLNIDVICFMPSLASNSDYSIYEKWLGRSTLVHTTAKSCRFEYFTCQDHKQPTCAQISRLYAGAIKELPEDEHLCVSDVDMYMNTFPLYAGKFTIWGTDLVPDGQFPMCYARGSVKEWRDLMEIGDKTYQECLDEIMTPIECENIRGNYWSLDQEILWNKTKYHAVRIGRARPGTQFAGSRIDRDDVGWRDHLNNFVDAHLWRPGYEEGNFANILELLNHRYPDENFQWLIDYRNEYIKLL